MSNNEKVTFIQDLILLTGPEGGAVIVHQQVSFENMELSKSPHYTCTSLKFCIFSILFVRFLINIDRIPGHRLCHSRVSHIDTHRLFYCIFSFTSLWGSLFFFSNASWWVVPLCWCTWHNRLGSSSQNWKNIMEMCPQLWWEFSSISSKKPMTLKRNISFFFWWNEGIVSCGWSRGGRRLYLLVESVSSSEGL